jgi:hypothetical protein
LVLRPESGERAVEEKQSPQSGKEGSKKVLQVLIMMVVVVVLLQARMEVKVSMDAGN